MQSSAHAVIRTCSHLCANVCRSPWILQQSTTKHSPVKLAQCHVCRSPWIMQQSTTRRCLLRLAQFQRLNASSDKAIACANVCRSPWIMQQSTTRRYLMRLAQFQRLSSFRSPHRCVAMSREYVFHACRCLSAQSMHRCLCTGRRLACC